MERLSETAAYSKSQYPMKKGIYGTTGDARIRENGPFTAVTRVRISLGTPRKCAARFPGHRGVAPARKTAPARLASPERRSRARAYPVPIGRTAESALIKSNPKHHPQAGRSATFRATCSLGPALRQEALNVTSSGVLRGCRRRSIEIYPAPARWSAQIRRVPWIRGGTSVNNCRSDVALYLLVPRRALRSNCCIAFASSVSATSRSVSRRLASNSA
jgi:hypothetical protein